MEGKKGKIIVTYTAAEMAQQFSDSNNQYSEIDILYDNYTVYQMLVLEKAFEALTNELDNFSFSIQKGSGKSVGKIAPKVGAYSINNNSSTSIRVSQAVADNLKLQDFIFSNKALDTIQLAKDINIDNDNDWTKPDGNYEISNLENPLLIRSLSFFRKSELSDLNNPNVTEYYSWLENSNNLGLDLSCNRLDQVWNLKFNNKELVFRCKYPLSTTGCNYEGIDDYFATSDYYGGRPSFGRISTVGCYLNNIRANFLYLFPALIPCEKEEGNTINVLQLKNNNLKLKTTLQKDLVTGTDGYGLGIEEETEGLITFIGRDNDTLKVLYPFVVSFGIGTSVNNSYKTFSTSFRYPFSRDNSYIFNYLREALHWKDAFRTTVLDNITNSDSGQIIAELNNFKWMDDKEDIQVEVEYILSLDGKSLILNFSRLHPTTPMKLFQLCLMENEDGKVSFMIGQNSAPYYKLIDKQPICRISGIYNDNGDILPNTIKTFPTLTNKFKNNNMKTLKDEWIIERFSPFKDVSQLPLSTFIVTSIDKEYQESDNYRIPENKELIGKWNGVTTIFELCPFDNCVLAVPFKTLD